MVRLWTVRLWTVRRIARKLSDKLVRRFGNWLCSREHPSCNGLVASLPGGLPHFGLGRLADGRLADGRLGSCAADHMKSFAISLLARKLQYALEPVSIASILLGTGFDEIFLSVSVLHDVRYLTNWYIQF